MFFPRDRSKEGIFLMADGKQHEIDMLHVSIWNKLPLFALPVAATAILEQLFNASDLAIVGNFTGEASTLAVAAVGANSPIIGLIVNLFIGIALGANVVIANAIGRGSRDAVRKAVHTSIVFSLLGGIVVNAGIYLSNEEDNWAATSRKRGIPLYLKAYNHKIVPIALTILSTVLGLVPFLYDGPEEVFWFAFAVAAISGTLFSLIALAVYLPIFLPMRRKPRPEP